MKRIKASFKVVLDTRQSKSDGKYALRLRVTSKNTRKYYGIGHKATKDEWAIINSEAAKGPLRKIKNAIGLLEIEAQKCAEALVPFSFIQFEQQFFRVKQGFKDVQSAFEYHMEQLKENDQWGTVASYQTACNTILKFKPNLQFEEVTKDFLFGFERWMLKNDKSISTVGIYVRALRTIMNLAKDNGTITPDQYPFGRRKYTIPTSRNIKKSLSIDEIKRIFHYPTEPGTNMDKAKDFWIFSYLCNGINMTDIANLRWGNLDSKTIIFMREKTKRSRRENPIKIVALRNQHIDRIIDKWKKVTYIDRNDYIFDILSLRDNAETARKKIQQFTHVNNKWTKRIGEDLHFEMPLTTYVARHSFATILVRSGAPLAFTSQTLGHSNITTTQRYFAGFDLAAQTAYTEALTKF